MKYFLILVTILTNSVLINNLETSTQTNQTLLVYGSDTCHYCLDTKAYLKKRNIEYVYYDVDENLEQQKEMIIKLKKANISLSNLSLPVIDNNGNVFINEGDFQEFLKRLDNQ